MASACSSTMSVQQSCASNATGNRCFLQRKKPVNPLAMSIRPPKVDAVRQRVRSARMLKIRSLQSQLNDANFHLMELAQENRALKSTQRRQDKALNGYEGVNADLPRLLQSHGEENRALQERNRTLKRQLREVTDTLKLRDDELLQTKDQLRQLTILAKDKQLEERAQLRQSLNEAKELISSYESEISVLNRKLSLEVKNCRQKLQAEASKYKKCQEELALALGQVKKPGGNRLLSRRFDNSPATTDRKSTTNLSASTSKDTIDSDVKLEPIAKRASAESRNSLTSPVEKIKARLSSNSDSRQPKIEDFSDILEKINLEEEHLKKSLQAGIKNTKLKTTKLETLVQKRNKLKVSAQPPPRPPPPPPPLTKLNPHHNHSEHINLESDNDNGEISDESPRFPLRNGVSDDSQSMSETEDALHQHVKSLQDSEKQYLRVQEELKDIEKLEEQIDKNKQTIILKREDNELVDEIWKEEYSFRIAQREKIAEMCDKPEARSTKQLTNGELEKELVAEGYHNHKDPMVALENKKKLLATLREIDNGNSIEHDDSKRDVVQNNNNEIDGSRKSRLMKELFG